ncbi:MAG: protein-glutamate O-methyltransferase CheR [Anaerolineales bacterium]|nr:protein-glutamate O-methyltransferase CheR [Anaerolineales bacterium]
MDDLLYQNIKVRVKQLYGIDLEHYKDQQMKRRLGSWLVRSGYSDWDTYFAQIKQDEKENGRLRDYLTINVSSFFRDPERWKTMQKEILPLLYAGRAGSRTSGEMRFWSAGCSIGAEPYSLIFQLDEMNHRNSYHLLATDLDRGALKLASEGGPYRKEDVDNISAERLEKYFISVAPPFYVKPEYIRRAKFSELDLINDNFEENFDLIICRNVVIYFTTVTKKYLFQKFSAALRPGGILFVGGTEIIPQAADLGLRSCGISLYQKTG